MPDFTGFDPRSLLSTVVKAKLDTAIPPFPLHERDEFEFLCRKVEVSIITAGPTSAKAGEQWVKLDTQWECLDEDVKRATHLEHPMARYSFILEVDPTRGLEIGEAKNVKLGRLLAACGIKGKEWSLSMIEGCPARGKIKHRVDEDDPSIIYNDIVRMTAA